MPNEIQKVASPFAAVAPAAPAQPDALAVIAAGAASSEVQVAQAKAQAEAFASIMAAKNWPRDEAKAADKLLNACMRPKLAEQAVYIYSRGGQDIQGPSIRLAEAAARAWGNLKYGFKVTASDKLHSEVLCFAYDMESNIPVERSFTVSHVRHTKKGDTLLTDPRDIYEKIANEAMRRVRACILECIPGDVIESAVEQCDATLRATADVSEATIKKLLDAFAMLGVTKSQIEARIQRHVDSIQPAQVLFLRKVFVSIKDGMSKPEDWFDATVVEGKVEKNVTPDKPAESSIAAAARKRKAAQEESKAEPAPDETQTKKEGGVLGLTDEMAREVAAAAAESIPHVYLH